MFRTEGHPSFAVNPKVSKASENVVVFQVFQSRFFVSFSFLAARVRVLH